MSSAISAATVHVILDYLCPLTAPLPAHLISSPLLQRHHFLSISPENPADYLAWPTSTPEEQSHAVALLQREPVPLHDHFPVNYLPDPQDFQAHVRITPDLRLVFLLDKLSGHWLYHNVTLMPFPANSYSSFDEAISVYSQDDFLPEQSDDFFVKEENDDDDNYWNAYGAGDDDHRHSSSADHLDPSPNSEDAYWAQYSAVQGSGDSTLPSPLPSKKKTLDQAVLDKPVPDRIIVPSDDLQTNHVDLYNPLEPPAPESLARRLEALSAESPSKSPTLFEFDGRAVDYPAPGEFVPSFNTAPASPGAVPALSISSSSSSPPPLQRSSDEFVVIDPATDADAVNHSVPAESLILSSDDSHDCDPTQDILRENIKGLYRLWKLGRHDTSSDDKEIFLANVRQALHQL